MKWGVCKSCRKRVPAEHVVREGQVYLKKACPDCKNDEETLISSDAEVWQKKRDLDKYDDSCEGKCALNCPECKTTHNYSAVFLDVTSRCNLACPICIANIPGMPVEYEPPLEYFAKVLDQLAEWNPRPRVNLFGGEPTVRKDCFEIIRMIKDRKMKVSLVTNGLKLASESYCEKVCKAGAEILFAFDGRAPEVYERMRGSTKAYDLKLKAIENMRKHSKRRHTWVCTLALGVNDHLIEDYFEFAHENRSIIRRIFFIPLTEMWDAGLYNTENEMTTPEEVERIVADAIPDEKVEFMPAGIFNKVLPAARFFGTKAIHFAGAHPNCESVAYFISDGEKYRPIGHFLNIPVTELLAQFLERAEKLNPKLEKLDPNRWFQRWRGRMKCIWAFGGLIRRATNFKKVFKGNPFVTWMRITLAVLMGQKFHHVLRKHTNFHDGLAAVILPFEEWDASESGRMMRCTSAFVHLNPEDEKIKTVPFCMWCHYRKDAFKRIAEKYPPLVKTVGAHDKSLVGPNSNVSADGPQAAATATETATETSDDAASGDAAS